MTEGELQEQIIQLAEGYLGWEVLHVRPARTLQGWRTPIQGKLGKGWPDLLMTRPPRAIAAELKSARGRVSDEQAHVLAQLRLSGIETHIWRPADWSDIVEALT